MVWHMLSRICEVTMSLRLAFVHSPYQQQAESDHCCDYLSKAVSGAAHALSCPAEFGPGTKGLLDSENASWLISQYFKDPQDAQDHRFAVIRADLKGLPPATVVTCEVDPIRDEGQAYAEKLEVTTLYRL